MATGKDNRNRPSWKLAALGTATAALLALLVHAATLNEMFEIDQDATASSLSGDDWDTLLINGHDGGTFTFIPDKVGDRGDDAYSTGGSKDERDISSTGITKTFWMNTTAEPPDKDDIGHAFAASYTAANDDLLIYFGADRFSNSGDAAIGFWFFQKNISDNNNSGLFTGEHTVGDILVTSDFRQGGGVGVINVFKWTGDPRAPLQLLVSKTLAQNATAPDVFCNDPITSNGTSYPANTICATSNRAPKLVPGENLAGAIQGADNSVWTGGYQFKGAGYVQQFPAGTFFEGGVNISALFAGQSLPCFASFLAMTRTSASTTAQLKDYVLGSFPLCGIDVGKACVVDATSPKINTDGISIHYKFAVPITNTGSAVVHNLGLVDDSVTEDDICKITKIGTTVLTTPLPLSADHEEAQPIISSLAGGDTVNVVVECDSLQNPFLNKVTAFASTSATGGTVLEADHTTGAGETCSATVNPALTVVKTCRLPVTFVANTLTPRVCVDITVTNTSSEKLIQGSLIDDKLGTLTTTLELLPGATSGTTFHNKCYNATAQDLPANTLPGEAMFSDYVLANARGAISGRLIGDLDANPVRPIPRADAHCPLCPTCVGEDCETTP